MAVQSHLILFYIFVIFFILKNLNNVQKLIIKIFFNDKCEMCTFILMAFIKISWRWNNCNRI